MSRIMKILKWEKASNAGLRTSSGNDLLLSLYQALLTNRSVVFYDPEKMDYIKSGYSGNAEVFKIIRKIVDKLSQADTYLYFDNGKAEKYRKFTHGTTPMDNAKGILFRAKALEFAPDNNDLTKLVKHPNNYQSWREMIELFRIFYFAQGEAFLYRETALNSDIALSLHVAPANLMTPVFSDDYNNIIKGWKIDLFGGRERLLDAQDVFHLKMSNPNFDSKGTQIRGLSPLFAGLKYLKLDDTSMEAWIKSVENEGAKGIISPNHADPNLWLTPEQVKLTEEKMQEKVHGVGNRNKVAVSGMPLQYTQIGLSPSALNIIEALDKAQVNLADLWNVPSVLFDPNPTYENQKEARRAFVSDVILPYLAKEEEKLNEWLVQPFAIRDKKKYILDNDSSVYEELKVSLDERASLAKILTINEMRVLEGYDEIDNEYANEIFIESGKVPLSDFSVNFSSTQNSGF